MVNVASCRARALFRGGNANNGANAGLFYVNVNNGVGYSNTNIGGRLSTSNRLSASPYLNTGHQVNHPSSEV